MVAAYVGLGANLGDRVTTLQRAVELLARRPEVWVLRASRVYDTDPVGGPPQPRFLNAVVELDTDLSPRELLGVCQEIEGALGRERRERWGPRRIDVDVLTYGEEAIEEPELTLPHPRMHERAFVLVPLLELDADPPLPHGRRAAGLRLSPELLGGVRVFGPSLQVPAG